MSKRRAQQEIGPTEFRDWMAYATIEPFGEVRADWRIAKLTVEVANLFRRRGQPGAKLADFMWKDKPPRQTAQQQRAIFFQFAQAHNAALAKKGKL